MIVVEALHHLNIPASNLKESVDFYTLFLDFELVSEEEAESALVRFDNVTLKLSASGTASESPAFAFLLDVDDFTDALQEIESKEVPIVNGPTETENGEKVIIKDPSGNLIELFYEE